MIEIIKDTNEVTTKMKAGEGKSALQLLREMLNEKNRLTIIHILLIGYFVSFIFFFVYPVFFMSAGMNYFKYIPSYVDKIGTDLIQNINYSRTLLEGKSPYVGHNLYTPFVSIVYIPFCAMAFQSAYIVLSACTFFAFISMFILAGKLHKTSPEMVLIFVSGIISYGFQFEIERGQFYTITMAILMWALYLVYFTKYKKTAYALFTLAVQLKIFPILFIWLIAERNWKKLVILAEINFAFLFILGYNVYFDFMKYFQFHSLSFQIQGNHSINGYMYFLNKEGLGPIIILIVLAGWLYANYRSKGFDVNTILYCTLTGLLVPSISHDYTLPILILPMVLLFQVEASKFILFLIAILYSSMLFSYVSKIVIPNNGLALLILSGLTLYLIARGRNDKNNTFIPV